MEAALVPRRETEAGDDPRRAVNRKSSTSNATVGRERKCHRERG